MSIGAIVVSIESMRFSRSITASAINGCVEAVISGICLDDVFVSSEDSRTFLLFEIDEGWRMGRARISPCPVEDILLMDDCDRIFCIPGRVLVIPCSEKICFVFTVCCANVLGKPRRCKR